MNHDRCIICGKRVKIPGISRIWNFLINRSFLNSGHFVFFYIIIDYIIRYPGKIMELCKKCIGETGVSRPARV
jgi:hypothetical protein